VLLAPPALSAAAKAEEAAVNSQRRMGIGGGAVNSHVGVTPSDVQLESRFDGLQLGDLAGSPLHRGR